MWFCMLLGVFWIFFQNFLSFGGLRGPNSTHFLYYSSIIHKNRHFCEKNFFVGGLTKKIKNFFLPIFRSWFLIGHWLFSSINFNSIEGLVSAFQNGMTLENPMKIERFTARNLRSGILVQNFAKTLGGFLGH